LEASTTDGVRPLQQFFKYLAEEGEVAESPLVRMRPPSGEEPVPA